MKARPKIVLVAAMARDRTIAKAGVIPWNHPRDRRFFKIVTMGTALVMGRKTFVANGRVLPGRDNIVVTRDVAEFAKTAPPGAFGVGSLEEAFALAVQRGAQRISVIGGGEIYAAALPVADAMILTYVPEDGGGDVFFPQFDEKDWRVKSRIKRGKLRFVRYARRRRRVAAT
jgi:dihydrofolate reductase